MNHNRRRGGALGTSGIRPRRERKPGVTRFEQREFATREERDAFWEQQMGRHPNVVRDTGVERVAADGVVKFRTTWRVRWPRG